MRLLPLATSAFAAIAALLVSSHGVATPAHAEDAKDAKDAKAKTFELKIATLAPARTP